MACGNGGRGSAPRVKEQPLGSRRARVEQELRRLFSSQMQSFARPDMIGVESRYSIAVSAKRSFHVGKQTDKVIIQQVDRRVVHECESAHSTIVLCDEACFTAR